MLQLAGSKEEKKMLQLAFVVALIEHTFDIYAYMDLIAYVRYLKIVKLLHNISIWNIDFRCFEFGRMLLIIGTQ
jgi:hypothetical protein